MRPYFLINIWAWGGHLAKMLSLHSLFNKILQDVGYCKVNSDFFSPLQQWHFWPFSRKDWLEFFSCWFVLSHVTFCSENCSGWFKFIGLMVFRVFFFLSFIEKPFKKKPKHCTLTPRYKRKLKMVGWGVGGEGWEGCCSRNGNEALFQQCPWPYPDPTRSVPDPSPQPTPAVAPGPVFLWRPSKAPGESS